MDDDTRDWMPEVDWDYHRECDYRDTAAVKFTTPDGSRIWYAAERDEDDVFRGLVINGDSAKLGYFDLDELEAYRDTLGKPVERDRDFDDANMGNLKEQFEFRKMAMTCAANKGRVEPQHRMQIAPRLPTQAEKDDLCRYVVNRCQQLFQGPIDGLDASNDMSLIQSVIDAARVAVFDDHSAGQMGDVGRIMLVAWPHAPSYYEAFVWNAATRDRGTSGLTLAKVNQEIALNRFWLE